MQDNSFPSNGGQNSRSAILPVGHQVVGITIRELVLPSIYLQRSGTRTETELPEDFPAIYNNSLAKTSTRTATNETSDVTATSKIINKQERRRKQWRNSKRQKRSLYDDTCVGDRIIETAEQRNIRLEKCWIHNALVRQNRSENDWTEVRRKHQLYKKTRLERENNNQRFWRLIRRRQWRRKGYHNMFLAKQYDRSIGKYGTRIPDFPDCISSCDKQIMVQLEIFYEMLHDIEIGEPIPDSKFETFRQKGIDLPRDFLKKFLDDQTSSENEL